MRKNGARHEGLKGGRERKDIMFQLKNILFDGVMVPPTPGEQLLELWPGLNLKEESTGAPRWTAKLLRP